MCKIITENGCKHICIKTTDDVARDFQHICAVQNMSYSRVMIKLMREYIGRNKELLKVPPTISKMAEMRIKAELTQAELARAVGCDQARISRYESGSFKPSRPMQIKIAEALNCSISDFL